MTNSSPPHSRVINMARLSSTKRDRLVLLVVLSVGLMVLVAEANTCSEDLGACDEKCNETCTSKHAGGKGDCVSTGSGDNVCRCYFECPKPKTCTEALGRCSAQCNVQCCDQQCKNKRPGGNGYCDDSLGPANNVCVCGYGC